LSNFGTEAYYENWMHDFTDDQYPDGSLPVIVPSPATCTVAPFPTCINWHNMEPVWESAVILMHTYLYTYYGDLWAARRDYATMAAWLNKVESLISSTGHRRPDLGFCLPDHAAGGGQLQLAAFRA
jgi:alpha-L-rhamnosidase